MSQPNRYLALRPGVLGLAKVLLLAVAQSPLVRAAPFHASSVLFTRDKDEEKEPDDPSLWLYLGVAAFLVLLGGAFAGLTIALMGQDEMYLQVIRESGEGAEQKHATRVLRLLHRGKHWVLVTLLLGNVITNETLPIVLDRSLGGGWPAVLGSTVLIVIFGEIAPQSVCVRYGLPIGAWMSPFVLALMYLLSPVAWPTAKLLDWLLGEDHGTVYKKAGLKTLVSLHKTLGDTGQKLNEDEVTIIGAVLDLKEKSVGSIMTPMDDVYTLSLDDVLDEDTMNELLSQGYSRVPIHHPDNDRNFVGMLLVKMLITYDPEDAMPVRDFALATLPETRPETSCLDIINFFQEGKSHMVLVSDFPGEDHGALGVLTLEDVIEELIGEEIVDESDVFVDVHKAIRRMTPAPRTRIPKGQVVEPETSATKSTEGDLVDINEEGTLSPGEIQRVKTVEATKKTKQSERTASPRQATLLLRRRSSAADQADHKAQRFNTAEMREHLKHLGPSNLASRPKTTRSTTVKIKPGNGAATQPANTGHGTPPRRVSEAGSTFSEGGGIGGGVIASAGKEASDGVQALQQGYGSIGNLNSSPTKSRPSTSVSKGVQADPQNLMDGSIKDGDTNLDGKARGRGESQSTGPRGRSSRSNSTIRSLPKKQNKSRSPTYSRGPARSGSITENIIDANGIRKVVLETNSSSSNEEDENSGANKGRRDDHGQDGGPGGVKVRGGGEDEDERGHVDGAAKKKKRRRRKQGHGKGEQEPLLGANR